MNTIYSGAKRFIRMEDTVR